MNAVADEEIYIGEDPFRVVEGPHSGQLEVYAHGVCVAILDEILQMCMCTRETPRFRGSIYDFRHLYWTHAGALRRLGGEPIQQILGLAAVYLGGRARPAWAVQPGLDAPRLIVPLENPGGLSVAEVFAIAVDDGL